MSINNNTTNIGNSGNLTIGKPWSSPILNNNNIKTNEYNELTFKINQNDEECKLNNVTSINKKKFNETNPINNVSYDGFKIILPKPSSSSTFRSARSSPTLSSVKIPLVPSSTKTTTTTTTTTITTRSCSNTATTISSPSCPAAKPKSKKSSSTIKSIVAKKKPKPKKTTRGKQNIIRKGNVISLRGSPKYNFDPNYPSNEEYYRKLYPVSVKVPSAEEINNIMKSISKYKNENDFKRVIKDKLQNSPNYFSHTKSRN